MLEKEVEPILEDNQIKNTAIIEVPDNSVVVFDNQTQVKVNFFKLVVDEFIYYFKKWFSNQPLDAFKKELDFKVALVFISFYALINTLFIGFIYKRMLSVFNVARGNFSFLTTFIQVPKIRIAFSFYVNTFLTFTFYILLLTFVVMLVAKICKTKYNDFKSTLALICINLIPLSVMSLASFIFYFIKIPLYFVFLVLAMITFILGIYLGFEKYLGKALKTPFWYLLSALSIFFLMFGFLGTYAVYNLLIKFMNSFGTYGF